MSSRKKLKKEVKKHLNPKLDDSIDELIENDRKEKINRVLKMVDKKINDNDDLKLNSQLKSQSQEVQLVNQEPLNVNKKLDQIVDLLHPFLGDVSNNLQERENKKILEDSVHELISVIKSQNLSPK